MASACDGAHAAVVGFTAEWQGRYASGEGDRPSHLSKTTAPLDSSSTGVKHGGTSQQQFGTL